MEASHRIAAELDEEMFVMFYEHSPDYS